MLKNFIKIPEKSSPEDEKNTEMFQDDEIKHIFGACKDVLSSYEFLNKFKGKKMYFHCLHLFVVEYCAFGNAH